MDGLQQTSRVNQQARYEEDRAGRDAPASTGREPQDASDESASTALTSLGSSGPSSLRAPVRGGGTDCDRNVDDEGTQLQPEGWRTPGKPAYETSCKGKMEWESAEADAASEGAGGRTSSAGCGVQGNGIRISPSSSTRQAAQRGEKARYVDDDGQKEQTMWETSAQETHSQGSCRASAEQTQTVSCYRCQA